MSYYSFVYIILVVTAANSLLNFYNFNNSNNKCENRPHQISKKPLHKIFRVLNPPCNISSMVCFNRAHGLCDDYRQLVVC